MADNRQRIQGAIWLCVVLILIASFLYTWRKMESTVVDTAYIVAGKRILEQANLYHQDWLLMKQPPMLSIDGQVIQLTDKGWATPINPIGKVDCYHWWSILYPAKEIFKGDFEKVESSSSRDGYQCIFHGSGQSISIGIVNDRFSVNVTLVAE